MNYTFKPQTLYRMPTHFGPSLGPRQGVDGRRYSNISTPNDTTMQASFKVAPDNIEPLLPPGFKLREPSIITLNFSYITNIEWLAGRGYNTFGISVPATYVGQEETVHGELQLVLWENHADPIITGREDLGFAKIYCEIPNAQRLGESVICRASWDGFEFASLRFENFREVSLEALPNPSGVDGYEESAGLLHYKYIPKTGCPGQADAEYAVLTPAGWPNQTIEQVLIADHAKMNFNPGTWEQLPTLVNIVDILSRLSLGECTDTIWVKMQGGKDLSDQRIVQ